MIEELYEAIETIRLYKMFHDFGRADKLESGHEADRDLYWTMIHDMSLNITDKVWYSFDESFATEKYYYSSSSMMEYYRLCREYSKKHNIPLECNPYIEKARRYAKDKFNQSLPYMDYALQTKINHDNASGIVIWIYHEYFNSYSELMEALLHIFSSYEYELIELKAALKSESMILMEAA